MEKSGVFDYIILETTGLADPGNLAPLFWVDEGLGSTIYLDGIVTLVDAQNILTSLNEPAMEDNHPSDHQGPFLTTAHLQISHADVIVINKADLVNPEKMEVVIDRVQAINGLAKIHITQQGQVPHLEGFLLDLHAYDDVGDLALATKGHSHLDPVLNLNLLCNPKSLTLFKTISTISITVPMLNIDQLPKLDAWLRSILWDAKLPHTERDGASLINQKAGLFEIHRLKARFPLIDGDVKIVQGVREIFDIKDAHEDKRKGTGEAVLSDYGKLVLIGRHISDVGFKESFLNEVIGIADQKI
jgi:G3E family GTPase